MRTTLLASLAAFAVACAASSPPPPASSSTQQSRGASASAASTPEGQRQSPPECSRVCQSYVHYKRGAMLECAEIGGCGSRATHPETVEYGRELRDTAVDRCGEACPEAVNDARNATKAKAR